MKKLWIGIFAFFCITVVAVGSYLWARGHVELETQNVRFTESAKELNNPERGFYYIYGFHIKDTREDYEKLVEEKFEKDKSTKLAMIQINLQEYRDREISKEGMEHLEELFCALDSLDKKFIVRFLYDWDGENIIYEPDRIDLILKHMEQVAPVVNKHYQKVYLLQGLFIGNWGEMNGTKFTSQESLQKLYKQLKAQIDEDIYLSVRMPAHWRKILESVGPADMEDTEGLRLGLYNDAIMGNEGDYGTYWTEGKRPSSVYEMWDRTAELEFQNELCRYVPNGGEVIRDNPLNDTENAVTTLQKMRLSYLNNDYDRNVLNKWKNHCMEDCGVYSGISGYDYIERHMGYRFLIDTADLTYDWKKDELDIKIILKNVGFAPIYYDKKLALTICDEEGKIVYSSEFEEDLRLLYGGEDADEKLMLNETLSVFGWDSKEYNIYFSILDEYTGEIIALGNEQVKNEHGYKIGTVTGGMKGWYLGEIFSQLQ